MEAVSYIDQLHHKLLHQIHSVGLPPQLIKGNVKSTQKTIYFEFSEENRNFEMVSVSFRKEKKSKF